MRKRRAHAALLLGLMLLTAWPAPAKAADPLDQLCQYGGGIQGLEWLCMIRPIWRRVVYLRDHFATDMEQFFEGLAWRYIEDAAGVVATEAGLQHMNWLTEQVYNALLLGPAQMRQRIREATAELYLSRLLARMRGETQQRYPEQSPSWWAERAVRAHPNLAIGSVVADYQQATLVSQSMEEAGKLMDMDRRVAEWVSEATSLEGFMESIMGSPTKEGKVAEIKRRIQTANSTRAAVQQLTEAVADLMGAGAAGNLEIIERLDRQIELQAFTLHQLQGILDELRQEQMAKANRFRAELESEMDSAYQDWRMGAEALYQAGRILQRTAEPVTLHGVRRT